MNSFALFVLGIFGFLVALFCALKLALMIFEAIKNKVEQNMHLEAENEKLKNGYRAVHGYLTETRDRGKGSPVGLYVREMVELIAFGDFDLRPTHASMDMRDGIDEQIQLDHMTPEDAAKMVRVS